MTKHMRRLPRSKCYGLGVLLAFASASLAGCGGGGGGDGGAPAHSLTLSRTSVSFAALAGDAAPESANVTISWTGSNVAGYVVGTLPGVPALPTWLAVSAQGSSSPSTLTLTRTSVQGLAPGQYSTTVRVVTGDSSLNVVDIADLTISLDVLPMPTFSPATLSTSWVESEQPAAQQVTMTRDNRVQYVSSVSMVPWLIISSVAGDTLTVSGTAGAQSVPLGDVTGSIRVAFALGGHQASVDVPVEGTVGRALQGPAALTYEVNASTQAADLVNITETVTTATQASVQWNAVTDQPWVTAASGTTGSNDNLVLQLQSNAIEQLSFGEHFATITLNPTTPNVSPIQIPITLNQRLPEVHFVAPVAFTDQDDYVVVRGRGLDDPSVDLRIDGALVPGATTLHDTAIKIPLTAGALAAGDHTVTVANELGFTRGSAKLRMSDPPGYADFSLDATVGLQDRIVSSPINHAVFTHMCFFCNVTGVGTSGTIQRFTYDPQSSQWTRTQHAFPGLFDFALSPDESQLIVLSQTELRLVDPVTMVPQITRMLPNSVNSISRQLAVTSDGLVIVSDLGLAFSLPSLDVVSLPIGFETGRAPVASRDGSRVLLPFNGPGGSAAPVRYYDATTGTIVSSTTLASDPRAAYDRHATAAFSDSHVFDENLTVRGTLVLPTGELSPDGTRIYAPDIATSKALVFDVTAAPFTQLPDIAIPGVPADKPARLAIDPHGDALFYITEQKFVVVALP